MNSLQQDRELKQFYNEIALPDEKVTTILDSCLYAALAKRWQRIAIASLVGLTAMTLLALSLFFSQPQNPATIVKSRPQKNSHSIPVLLPDGKFVENQQPRNVTRVDSKKPKFRLISFRSHGNACPHCRETKKVFEELEQEMKSVPLHFADFQLNQPLPRKTVQELKLQPLVAGRSETAFLVLTTLEGEKIQEFKPSMGMKRIQKSILEIMKK